MVQNRIIVRVSTFGVCVGCCCISFFVCIIVVLRVKDEFENQKVVSRQTRRFSGTGYLGCAVANTSSQEHIAVAIDEIHGTLVHGCFGVVLCRYNSIEFVACSIFISWEWIVTSLVFRLVQWIAASTQGRDVRKR